MHSLHDLLNLLQAANNRYLAFAACINNPDVCHRTIGKMVSLGEEKGRSYRDVNIIFNLDYILFLTLAGDEWVISGFRAADLRAHMLELTPWRSSCLLKRLRTHSMIKKIGHTYEYNMTKLEHRIVAPSLILREWFVLSALAKISQ
jgi:hypothetical protein